jgi:hypothetical protein
MAAYPAQKIYSIDMVVKQQKAAKIPKLGANHIKSIIFQKCKKINGKISVIPLGRYPYF